MELKDLKVGDNVLYKGGYGERAIYTVLDITKSGYIKVGYKVGKKEYSCLFNAKTGKPKGDNLSHQEIQPLDKKGFINEKRCAFVRWVERHLREDYRNMTFEQAMVVARTLKMQPKELFDNIEEDLKLWLNLLAVL